MACYIAWKTVPFFSERMIDFHCFESTQKDSGKYQKCHVRSSKYDNFFDHITHCRNIRKTIMSWPYRKIGNHIRYTRRSNLSSGLVFKLLLKELNKKKFYMISPWLVWHSPWLVWHSPWLVWHSPWHFPQEMVIKVYLKHLLNTTNLWYRIEFNWNVTKIKLYNIFSYEIRRLQKFKLRVFSI